MSFIPWGMVTAHHRRCVSPPFMGVLAASGGCVVISLKSLVIVGGAGSSMSSLVGSGRGIRGNQEPVLKGITELLCNKRVMIRCMGMHSES